MKKNVLFLCTLYIASLALILTGCKSNEPEPIAEAQTYHVSIQAGKGDANQQNGPRKALGLDGTTLTASWKTGEQVSVRNVTKSTDLTGYLVAESNGVQTTISGDLTGTINAGDELLLKFLSPDYTNQQGTLEYIELHCDYAEATIHVTSVTWGNIEFEESIADFENRQSIVKFTLMNEAKDAALAASDLKVEVDNRPYNIHVDPATSEIFVALPGFSDKTIKLTATVGTETYTYTSPTGKTFEDGKYYAITVGMPKKVLSFSIDPTHQIEFAKGNLQYKHSETKWRIATNQYDFVGSYMEVHAFGNGLWYDYPAIGNVYEGGNKCNNADPNTDVMSTNCWIDLFGWNTANNPLLISDNMADYATDQSSFVDWGTNVIYDGDVPRPANYWRTPTEDEWKYILYGRDNADHLCGTASITTDYGDAKGLILLPDGFEKPDGITFHYITDPTSNYPMTFSYTDYSGASGYPNTILTLDPKTDENFHITLANALNADNYVYNQNRYTKAQWEQMEAAGAVFLPVAGWMQVRYVDKYDPSAGVWALHRFANFVGGYWSSSYWVNEDASYLMLTHEQGKVGFGSQPFCNGQAVRLVHNLY